MNLDRVQIFKGWVDLEGEAQEPIYEVAWSDNRKPDANSKLPAAGDTVNRETASYENSIGNAELTAVFNDPDFDTSQRAV